MGLFRSRAKKKREKAAAELPREPARTAEAPAEVAPSKVTAEAPAEVAPSKATAEAQAEVAARKVTAEARPNPDKPGWGQAIGQQIGKARQDRASQE